MKCEKTPSGGQRTIGRHVVISLCAACTGCILCAFSICPHHTTLPRRCLHGVHRVQHPGRHMAAAFASALPARGASEPRRWRIVCTGPLPRRCLHGVHLRDMLSTADGGRLCLGAACTGCIRQMLPRPRSGSSLPRRCLHGVHLSVEAVHVSLHTLCLGAACTGCFGKSRQIAAHHLVAYAVSR